MHCQYVDANSSAFFYYQIVARNLVIFQSNSLVRASETMKSNTKVIRKKSWIELTLGVGKGHFFSDHSTLTNKPDAKMQLSLIFFEDLGF